MTKREIKKKFDEIVAFAELEKFLDTPVKRYSSGMYVRLAFAVAAHLEPEILVVDEVLAVGDAQFQKKCLGKMEEVGKEGRTVLFVSHNLTAIRILCTRALLLSRGMLVFDESPNAVVSEYMADIKESVVIKEWSDEASAPQNTSIVIRKVVLCDDNGNLLDEIYTDTPFNIAIDYKVKEEGAFVGLTLIIYDNENNCVLSSISNYEPNWYGKPMPTGTFKTMCKIPADLLNNGCFSVALNLFGKGFTDARIYREILKLDIFDGANLRGDYYGSWSGVVRPALDWSTTKVVL
jgi:lipopolysaccharide transport system ATP-binding protein